MEGKEDFDGEKDGRKEGSASCVETVDGSSVSFAFEGRRVVGREVGLEIGNSLGEKVGGIFVLEEGLIVIAGIGGMVSPL